MWKRKRDRWEEGKEGKTSSLGKPQRYVWGGRVGIATRRIFGFRLWQSIRQIREVFFHFKSIEDMFSNAKRRFLNSILYHENNTLRLLSQLLRETEEKQSNALKFAL